MSVRLPSLLLFLIALTTLPTGSFAAVPAARPIVKRGIDVLEESGFKVLIGKRVGLLTHPAAVNRRGETSIDVLKRAKGIRLVALFAGEHGLRNEYPAEKTFPDAVDARTRLPVFSLYNGKTKNFAPTAAQLKGIDVLVIDFQDVGVRSYTFIGAMKTAMEACFQNRTEVVVLDRPNPLGGLKVDGPTLDEKWMSDVGRFRMPYVYGLTIGELAKMALALRPPSGLQLTSAQRSNAKLTVMPLQGWRRSMRWPDTGLEWIPTSPLLADFASIQGYAMTGLGCILGGFRHGIPNLENNRHAFRAITHSRASPETVMKALTAEKIEGVRLAKINVLNSKNGIPSSGLYVEIIDYDRWRPIELSLNLMTLACTLEPANPFSMASAAEKRTFLIHFGSEAFFAEISAKGTATDTKKWLQLWSAQALTFQKGSQRYWLYN